MLVMVSSTYRDLVPERDRARAVIDQLAKEGHPLAWSGMEQFGSMATSPLEASRHAAESAQLVVLLVGSGYGSMPPDGELSFTAEEYEIVRAQRLPCLAYVKALPESQLTAAALAFRRQIEAELTCKHFDSVDALAEQLSSDLKREVQALRGPGDQGDSVASVVPSLDPRAFKDRHDALELLEEALAFDHARVAVVGPSGLGKTTLVQEYLRRRSADLVDPIWLRTDELFGRDAAGRVVVGVKRWTRLQLAERIERLFVERPRAILVFDNVQAVPLEIAWLATRLPRARCVFISWDARAVPASTASIEVSPIPAPHDRELVEYYCSAKQRLDSAGVDSLCRLAEGDALILTFAGRMLKATKGLRPQELADRWESSRIEMLRAEGPTIDRARVQIRSLLLNVYQSLEPSERTMVTLLSLLQRQGISQESATWACGQDDGSVRLDRAIQLGLIDARSEPDWQGHRYRIRSIVVECLRTTDAYPRSTAAFAAYLRSRAGLLDSSCELSALALQVQLDAAAPDLPYDGDWVAPLCVTAVPVKRARILAVLRGLSDPAQLAHLIEAFAAALARPKPADVTLELVELVATWRVPTAEAFLKERLRRPRTLDAGSEPVLDGAVQAAAAAGLSLLAGQSLTEYVVESLHHPNRSIVHNGLRVAGERKLLGALEAIQGRLGDPASSTRAEAALNLSNYDPQPELVEQLLQMAESDPNDAARREALATLGVWREPRALKPLLALLNSPDAEARATTVSVLWRYPTDEVVARLLAHWQREDDLDTRVNIAFVLSDIRPAQAVPLVLELMEGLSHRERFHGAMFAGLIGKSGLSDTMRSVVIERLLPLRASTSISMRLVVRQALITLGSADDLAGLWRDATYQSSSEPEAGPYRYHAVRALATSPVLAAVEPLQLESLLADPSPVMRYAAALVAGQLRDRELVPSLTNLLRDNTPVFNEKPELTVGLTASQALDRIAGKRPLWVPFSKPGAPP